MVIHSPDSDCTYILACLAAGRKITAKQMSRACGCDHTAARIRDLKNDGYNIRTTMIPVLNRKRKTVRVAQYSLRVD